ncbi:ArfGap-domain-containing protein [Rozella allomycis CSF55]|uniref:Arf GTPase activating protein domain-containing protein n=1 Tax=Rozella allomycis (strain CSF55) TaxID=988480 RepID=A0A075AN14_ROZAC|nr:Arf GTPase activating protein domain-containing protein [Rozella allomycis CSF55]RKP20448.1 ArfGap-domain-containing protein [Rozella allomycis CSF55]|eukprot:EPZ31131.1 Arf GTPase activating protein domain-containing protein [Rozella allomycis CSF55]
MLLLDFKLTFGNLEFSTLEAKMGSTLSEKEKKKLHEKHEKILQEMMNDEANKYCADCNTRGTRWASWNLGVFLCIRCGGIHRKLGTHISKIKSITLDTWTEEQIKSIQEKGNSKMNAIYCPHPERHPAPTINYSALEHYIRDKYERKLFGTDSINSRPVNSTQLNTTTSSSYGQYSSEIRKLNEMGFTDNNLCLEALKQTNGNVAAALDVLVANNSSNSNTVTPAERNALNQLKNMGFADENLNLQTYKRLNGKMDEVVSFLAEQNAKNEKLAPSNTAQKSNFVQQDLLSLDFGGAQQESNPFQAESANTFQSPSMQVFSENPFQASTLGNQWNNSNVGVTRDILSLYNQTSTTNNQLGQATNNVSQNQFNQMTQFENPFNQTSSFSGQENNSFSNPFGQSFNAQAATSATVSQNQQFSSFQRAPNSVNSFTATPAAASQSQQFASFQNPQNSLNNFKTQQQNDSLPNAFMNATPFGISTPLNTFETTSITASNSFQSTSIAPSAGLSNFQSTKMQAPAAPQFNSNPFQTQNNLNTFQAPIPTSTSLNNGFTSQPFSNHFLFTQIDSYSTSSSAYNSNQTPRSNQQPQNNDPFANLMAPLNSANNQTKAQNQNGPLNPFY